MVRFLPLLLWYRAVFYWRLLKLDNPLKRQDTLLMLAFLAAVFVALPLLQYAGLTNLLPLLYVRADPEGVWALVSALGVAMGGVLVHALLEGLPRDRAVPWLFWLSPVPRWMLLGDRLLSVVLFAVAFSYPFLLAAWKAFPGDLGVYWVFVLPLLPVWRRLKGPVLALFYLGIGWLAVQALPLAYSFRGDLSSYLAELSARLAGPANVLAPLGSPVHWPFALQGALTLALLGLLVNSVRTLNPWARQPEVPRFPVPSRLPWPL